MSDSFQSMLAILVLIAVAAVTRMIVAWRYRQAADAVVNDLKQAGAVNENRAVTLPYAQTVWYRFAMRNYRRKTLEGLLSHGLVGLTADGRHYLRTGTGHDPAATPRRRDSSLTRGRP
jgi:hypothetical protein